MIWLVPVTVFVLVCCAAPRDTAPLAIGERNAAPYPWRPGAIATAVQSGWQRGIYGPRLCRYVARWVYPVRPEGGVARWPPPEGDRAASELWIRLCLRVATIESIEQDRRWNSA